MYDWKEMISWLCEFLFLLEACGKVMWFSKMVSVFSTALLVCICSSFWLIQPLTPRTWESLPAAGEGIWTSENVLTLICVWEDWQPKLYGLPAVCEVDLKVQTSTCSSATVKGWYSVNTHEWVNFQCNYQNTSDKAKAIIKLYLFFPADLIHCS